MNTECPVCGATIDLDESSLVGELIECADCGIELEIKSLHPPIVEEAPQEEEDWGE